MLHVQEDGEVRGPSPFPLRCDFCLVVLSFQSLWVVLVVPRRVIDLLACWWSSGQSRSATVWKMAPICLFLCLWRERNNQSFEEWRRPLRNFYPPITFCIFGLRLMCSPYLLAFFIFLLISLVRRFLLYTPSVLRGASRFK
jgi:hypothetical protein